MTLFALGLNHKTAPLALREAVAFPDAELPDALSDLRRQGLDAALLSTCNRTEVYAVAPNADCLLTWLGQNRKLDTQCLRPHFYVHENRDCVVHAMRVAAGLDSLILGEPQILGQMKQSFQLAQANAPLHPTLSRLFEHAFSLAKLVRTDTDIGAHPVSIASTGIGLIHRIFAEDASLTALLIGAGEMIRLCAQHLQHSGVRRMIFANRTLTRAQALAEQHHGSAIALSDVFRYLPEADVVISCTAHTGHLVTLAMAKAAIAARQHRPMFMLDLAVPRDLEPSIAALEDVYLYTVDDLRDAISDNLRARQVAATSAESMIESRADAFMAWLASREATDSIQQLRDYAETQSESVMLRAQRLLAQGKSAEEALEYLRRGLLNKLLHAPSVALRESSTTEREQLQALADRLFKISPEID